jgi:hypothetical protein
MGRITQPLFQGLSCLAQTNGSTTVILDSLEYGERIKVRQFPFATEHDSR